MACVVSAPSPTHPSSSSSLVDVVCRGPEHYGRKRRYDNGGGGLNSGAIERDTVPRWSCGAQLALAEHASGTYDEWGDEIVQCKIPRRHDGHYFMSSCVLGKDDDEDDDDEDEDEDDDDDDEKDDRNRRREDASDDDQPESKNLYEKPQVNCRVGRIVKPSRLSRRVRIPLPRPLEDSGNSYSLIWNRLQQEAKRTERHRQRLLHASKPCSSMRESKEPKSSHREVAAPTGTTAISTESSAKTEEQRGEAAGLQFAWRLNPDSRTPMYSVRQMWRICKKVLKDREHEVHDFYQDLLTKKLGEQFDHFVKFTQNELTRNFERSSAPSYIS